MSGIPKHKNLMNLVRKAALSGKFLLLPHAVERRLQRDIAVPDIVNVLTNGNHEPEKDSFKEEFQSWNYAIRGQTIDGKNLRIAVTFDENMMLVITVIPLGRRR